VKHIVCCAALAVAGMAALSVPLMAALSVPLAVPAAAAPTPTSPRP